jgi:hypothetical protein
MMQNKDLHKYVCSISSIWFLTTYTSLGDFNTNNSYFHINACEDATYATYANLDVYGEMMSFDIGYFNGTLTF